ncbi:MAG: CBS domain-containing protein [Halobacteria archaeon]|nr:CBS domain-containing protein [Halobacteria archaeon]
MLTRILVKDVMTTDVRTASPQTTVLEAANKLRGEDIGSLVVMENDNPAGIVTESDFIELLKRGEDVSKVELSEFMSKIISIGSSASLEQASRKLRQHDVKRLPVIDDGDGELVGILTTTDLSYYLPHVQHRHEKRERRSGTAGVTKLEQDDWEFDQTGLEDKEVDVGDGVSFSKTIDDEDVRRFADISGDTNRLHLDDDFAKGTRFGGRIAHGILVAGVISAALARLPGLVIYLSQQLSFTAPVEIGDEVTAVCEVVDDLKGNRYRLATTVYDEDDKKVLDGDAVVLIDVETDEGGETDAGEMAKTTN